MALKNQAVIDRMTLEDKVALCSGADSWHTRAFEQYGIPAIMMTDGPHGLRKEPPGGDLNFGKNIPATCFPTACATACSWDRALLQEIGAALGQEALQEGVSILLGPGVNIKRNPLCGRNFEYFSEDPLLAGELGAVMIRAIQSQGVGVSLKHFAANSQENARMVSDSLIDERTLREIYLAAFEKAVKSASPATVMCAYNKLNGSYCSDHRPLLGEILRTEWGFEGVVISDWGAVNDRIEAFRAGLDLEMPNSKGYFDGEVTAAVQSGTLPEQVVNESVDRLLTLIFSSEAKKKEGFRYDVEAHAALAQRAAAASAVLLKNDGALLPLQAGVKMAVIGELARQPRYQGAGSSFVTPTRLSNALDGFNARSMAYTFFPGYELVDAGNQDLLEAALAGARQAEIAVIFAGLPPVSEAEGYDRKDMHLPDAQNELIRRVAQVQPKTVVVLSAGAPVEMPWLEAVPAVLHMHLPGQAGGLAVASLLAGEVNPSGKLAESYPVKYEDVPSAGFYEKGGQQAQYREGIYVGYRYYDKAKKQVCFPFGHGLSYTTFEYTSLVCSTREIDAGSGLDVSVTLRNTGSRDGAEVVQVYVASPNDGSYRPEKELREFAKIFLKAGETGQVKFHLEMRAFAVYDPGSNGWAVPGGNYTIQAAASSRDIRLQEQVNVRGQVLPSAGHPAWYTTPVGQPGQADFEALLGRRIEPAPGEVRGSHTLNSSFRDMQANWIIRLVLRSIKKSVGKKFGMLDLSDPNHRMVMEILETNPLKSLVMASGGLLTRSKAQGLVDLANGQVLKALHSFRQKE